MAGLDRAINRKIVEKLEEVKDEDETIYNLLKDALWQEHLKRNKRKWSYSPWYMKLIEKYTKEGEE
ncbi:MAG: hypothetical protein ACFFER_04410 [Candidatus Thorarchaeota archaeon]